MLKNGLSVIKKAGLNYIVKDGGKIAKYKPWLGDAFSFLYDFIMEKSVFPKKFGVDFKRHYDILSTEFQDIHGKRVLELATGTGSAVRFLPPDNTYAGIDISPGLLKKAVKKFGDAGFKNAELYVTSADDLPFRDNLFEMILCIVSLNFFPDIDKVFAEIYRVSAPGAVFICSIPVPERKKGRSPIRGTLYTKEEYEGICSKHSLKFEAIPEENGPLLYFRAVRP